MRAFPLLAAVAIALPLSARADGLIQKLPKDGSKVVYEMNAVHTEGDGRVRKFDGTLSVASVGTEKVDGADCRWIEVNFTMKHEGRERKVIAKVLIPESDLGQGKFPLANVKRGWIRMRDGRKPDKLNDPFSRKGGPLPALLPTPLSDVKKLKAAEVKTGIGKLTCKGLTGKTSYEQGDAKRTDKFVVEYESRLSDKTPFGVAACKLTMTEYRNKTEKDDVIVMTLKVKSVAKDAKSELPDSK